MNCLIHPSIRLLSNSQEGLLALSENISISAAISFSTKSDFKATILVFPLFGMSDCTLHSL